MDKEFERNYCPIIATSIQRVGHDSTKFLIWIAFYDSYYEKMKYFYLLASVSLCLGEKYPR